MKNKVQKILTLIVSIFLFNLGIIQLIFVLNLHYFYGTIFMK